MSYPTPFDRFFRFACQTSAAILERLLTKGPCRFVDLRGSTQTSPGSLVRQLNHLTADGLLFLDQQRRYALVEPEALRSRLSTFRLRFPEVLSDAAQEIFDEAP